MAKLKKILIILFSALAGLYLLFVFTLLNFPYYALVTRLDQYLRIQYGAGVEVQSVRYRYPMKLHFEDLVVIHEGSSLVISFDDLFVRLRLLTPTRNKTLEMNGSGMEVRSQWIEATRASASLLVRGRPLALLRGTEGNHLSSVRFMTGGADVQRVFVSGFEFSDLRLKQIQLSLRGDAEGLIIERGVVSADVVRSDLEGRVGLESLDILIRTQLTDEFYQKFADLRSIVDAVFNNGVLQIRIEGSMQNPRIRIVQ
jgi:hypothetical protein